jgi:uncharacterized pyridoxal phosphate-containing UPF0001 family protein
MQIRIGNKKLVMFLANVDDILDNDVARLLKKKNPSWTEKECNEMAELLKQFGVQFFDLKIKTIMGIINPKESEQKIQQEFEQLKIKFEAFAKLKGITIK